MQRKTNLDTDLTSLQNQPEMIIKVLEENKGENQNNLGFGND